MHPYLIGAFPGTCEARIDRPVYGMDDAAEELKRLGEGLVTITNGLARAAEPLCRALTSLRPSQILRMLDARGLATFLRGLFDFHGAILDPDPHLEARNWVIHVEVPDRRWSLAAKLAMRFFAVSATAATDEQGVRRFLVVFDEESVARFLKTVKPLTWRPWENPPLTRKWRLYEHVGDPICALQW